MQKNLKKHLSIKKRSKSKKYTRKTSRKTSRKVKKSRKRVRKNDGIAEGDLVSYTKGGWFEKPRLGRISPKRPPNPHNNEWCKEGEFDVDNMNGNIECIKTKNIKVKNLTYSEQQQKNIAESNTNLYKKEYRLSPPPISPKPNTYSRVA